MVTCCAGSPAIAERVRSILRRYEDDGPAASVIRAEQPDDFSANSPANSLVFLILSADLEQSAAAIADLRKATRAPIIAVGVREPKEVLRVIRAGAADFLCADDDLDTEIDGVMQRVALHEPRSTCGRIVTVTASHGGAGRSVIACNLAVALARQSGRCALCDMQLHGGDLALLLNVSPAHTIVDLCRNVETLDQSMFEQSLVQHESGIHLLAAPLAPKESNEVAPSSILQVLKTSRRTYGTTVLDMNDPFRDDQAALLRQSDVMVTVLRPDLPSLIKTCRLLKYFESIGITSTALRLVVNRSGELGELPLSRIEECLAHRIDISLPEDAKTVNASVNVGTPVILESPKARFTKGILQLADCVDSCKKN